MRVGDYAVDGVVEKSGRGEVYAATGPSGEPVTVSVFVAAAPERFLAEIEPLRGLDAFYTEPILATGTAEGLPYVVTPRQTGPTLRQEVTGHGPIEGPRLHRLAIATMTALVGIHQAGALHGELSPDRITLGDQGPTV